MSKRNLVLTKTFSKAFKKFTRNQPELKQAIEQSLLILESDAFSPLLKTHKLSGKLFGLLACTCGYDCRIVFTIDIDPKTKKEIITLIDLGSHDDVY